MTPANVLVVIVAVALEAAAAAQGGVVTFPTCGSGFLGLAYLMPRPETAAVFSGTVVEVRHPDGTVIVAFDVDRVWKGAISKRTALYRPNPTSTDSRQVFDLGERYVVLAHSLTAAERAQFHADAAPPDVLAVGLCGDGSRPFKFAEPELTELGPGRPPQ